MQEQWNSSTCLNCYIATLHTFPLKYIVEQAYFISPSNQIHPLGHFIMHFGTKVGNLKGYLFWPPFLKVFCQKWKFGRAKEMSASAGIWTRVPRSKGSYAIQWATLLLIENQQKLASYNNFCFGPFLTKNFQKGNGQNRYIFELLTLHTF